MHHSAVLITRSSCSPRGKMYSNVFMGNRRGSEGGLNTRVLYAAKVVVGTAPLAVAGAHVWPPGLVVDSETRHSMQPRGRKLEGR